MKLLSFDTETAKIMPALQAPPLVCLTWQFLGEPHPSIEAFADGRIHDLFESWLRDPDVVFVGHNPAFDMAVMVEEFPDLKPFIFAAYKAHRVTCTLIRQQLLDTAAGCLRGSVTSNGRRISHRYDLEYTLTRHSPTMRLRKDAWRTSYGPLRDVPLRDWVATAPSIQAAGRVRLAEVQRQLDAWARLKKKDQKKKAIEALKDELQGLTDMVASDPERVTQYPLEDATAPLIIHQSQEKHAYYLENQYFQAYSDFVMKLQSAWGGRTDSVGCERLRADAQAQIEELDEELIEAGLVREDGTRNTKAAAALMVRVCRERGITPEFTASHFGDNGRTVTCPAGDQCEEHIALGADACERSEDETLISYAERTTLGKQLSNDIPTLERGMVHPVHTRYGWANTGRLTSSNPNVQNQSTRPGFREAWVPRPGMLFFECDFPGLELFTWAQCCKSWFGFSKLAEALNAGLDPHLVLGADLLGITYQEALANKKRTDVARARKQSKPGNFGFAGGMGIPKFVKSTRKQVVAAAGREAWREMGLDAVVGTLRDGSPKLKAHELKEKWEARWTESKPHFARVRELTKDGPAMVETLFSKRFRGGCSYCATANNGFQALGADCAKRAAQLIAEAQYLGTPSKWWAEHHPGEPSPLFGSRTIFTVHDEFIGETPDDDTAHDAAFELADLMREGANEFLPDVPIPRSKMEPVLMRRWYKKAESTFDTRGRLVPWEPTS